MLKKFVSLSLCITIITFAACNEEVKEEPAEDVKPVVVQDAPAVIPVTLVNMYPHNTTAYTEGLQYVDGVMYESTGHYGRSFLYKYEPTTGKVIKEVKLDNKFFGEGMTVLGDKIYMLTYREKTGLIFDKNTLQQIGTFSYPNAEGWGMTNNDTNLVYSEGTAYIYFMNPSTFEVIRKIEVRDNYGIVSNINELEYINGYIYANQYETEFILKIDPNTGKVVGQADLRHIRKQAGIPPNTHAEGQPEVLNGIAYDKEKNRVFVTGKNWPLLLEVKLDN
jgi:glutamine cyclotransferase